MTTRQRGFSLIEALIALVLLSFGLLGMAAMQITALKSATQAYQRSIITLAAVDAQERLWAGLRSAETCDDIENQETFSGDDDNISWEEYWFGESSNTPIRKIGPKDKVKRSKCEFTITFNLEDDSCENDEDNCEFKYIFRLPDPKDL